MRELAPGLVSFVATIFLAPLIASIARRKGVVSGSSGVRWCYEPKPLLGGLSIILAIILALILQV